VLPKNISPKQAGCTSSAQTCRNNWSPPSIQSDTCAGIPPILRMACHHQLVRLSDRLGRSEDRKLNVGHVVEAEADPPQTVSLDRLPGRELLNYSTPALQLTLCSPKGSMPTRFDKTPMRDVLLLELRCRMAVAMAMTMPPLPRLNPRRLQLARRPRRKLQRERRKKR
jgi:hypothetical protein